MTSRYDLFKKSENKEYVSEQDLKKITNYMWNLKNWTPNYHYWYNIYSYTSKAYIFVDGEKKEVECQLRDGRKQLVKINWLVFLKIHPTKIVRVDLFIISNFFFFYRKCLMLLVYLLKNHLNQCLFSNKILNCHIILNLMNVKFPIKLPVKLQDMICMLLKIKKFYQKQTQSFHLI